MRSLKTRLATELSGAPHLQCISDPLQRDIRLPALLMQALQSAMEIGGSDLGNIQLLDPQSGSFKIVVHRGFDQKFLDYFNHVHAGQFGCGSAMQRQARVMVEDVREGTIRHDARVKHRAFEHRTLAESATCVRARAVL